MLGILLSLSGIYLTLRYAYPMSTLLSESTWGTLAVTTTEIYIAAQAVALGACRLRALNSHLILKLDLNSRQPYPDTVTHIRRRRALAQELSGDQ